jgi:hypothetical protein
MIKLGGNFGFARDAGSSSRLRAGDCLRAIMRDVRPWYSAATWHKAINSSVLA